MSTDLGRLLRPSWRRLLANVSGGSSVTPGTTRTKTRAAAASRRRQRYFCRSCGATFEGHQAACSECGGGMLEPTDGQPR